MSSYASFLSHFQVPFRLNSCADFGPSSISFTASLYSAIAGSTLSNENFCVSPFALQALLGLVRTGASDETALEIKSSLAFPLNPRDIESVIKTINPLLHNGKNYVYVSADRIYIDASYSIKKDLKKVAETQYEVDIELIDFGKLAAAQQIINDWVRSKCHQKVAQLLTSKNMSSAVPAMIVVSAVYFECYFKNWQLNGKQKFYQNENDFVETETLEKTGMYKYYECGELKARILQIQIENNTVDMIVVLPNSKNGLHALEKQVQQVFLKPKFLDCRVNVVMPKFRIENNLCLKRELQRIGLKTAFSQQANFGNFIVNGSSPFISDVFQTTVVNVVEGGADASGRVLGHQRRAPHEKKTFIVDRPFLFYLKVKNIIITAGRVVNPS